MHRTGTMRGNFVTNLDCGSDDIRGVWGEESEVTVGKRFVLTPIRPLRPEVRRAHKTRAVSDTSSSGEEPVNANEHRAGTRGHHGIFTSDIKLSAGSAHMRLSGPPHQTRY